LKLKDGKKEEDKNNVVQILKEVEYDEDEEKK
jgi:hypothetical protein